MQRNWAWLIFTLILVAAAIYIVLPTPPLQLGSFNSDLSLRQGLDLRGGLQVLLEADVPAGTELTAEQMEVAKQIVDNRVNGLGLTEPLVQRQGNNRIVVELPAVTDPQQAVDTLKETGLLEFVH